ncbi:MAG: hypothetical protein Q7K13_02420 [Polynucleobacter sp.]|uniref:hypothetical protein n=1 Tax=Polynucleobacter sp. TaxID=2029855 RepID=UPI00271D4DE6|nr:hypothetical protein [Polynucleobacter sp.]MDO8713319.1 hypothetical protein [Polynucleobacter sp.]
MTLEIIDDALEELEELPAIEFVVFPAEFVSKLGGGIARCLNINNRPFPIKSGDPYEIFFLEPAYVATVEIEFSKPILGAGIQLSVHDSLSNRNVTKKIDKDSLSSTIAFNVNCVSSGISIYLQTSYFELFRKRTLEVKQIRILGFTPKDFETLTVSLTHLQGLREATIKELSNEKIDLQSRQDKVQQRETSVTQLEVNKKAELADLEQTLVTAKEETTQATASLVSLKDEISRAETRKQAVVDQISAFEATARSIDGEVSKGKEQLRALATETSEAERRLRGLTNNVNLFSEEFSSFSDHGAKQAGTFIGLSIVPLVIILILTAQLLLGAVDLSVKYVKEPNIDLVTIFVTRLPYLTICGSILAVCYSALNFLFNRISVIYAERLDFSKIGIIAKDIASASANGLLLSDKQLYEARTYLKIEMLKSYLGGSIGSFTYTKRNEKAAQNSAPKKDQPESESPAVEDK